MLTRSFQFRTKPAHSGDTQRSAKRQLIASGRSANLLAIVISLIFTLLWSEAAYASCSALKSNQLDKNTTHFTFPGGLIEAKVVDSPEERSVKILSRGPFDEEDFRGQRLIPRKVSVVGASFKQPESSDPFSFIIVAFLNEQENVQWFVLLSKATEGSVAIASNLNQELRCDEIPNDRAAGLLPVPAGFETEISIADVTDPSLVYKRLGWQ